MTEKEFKQLFDAHFDEIRNYIWFRCGDGELASDIAQEAFIKLWEKRPYSDHTKLRGLLFKIASNSFVSSYRKKTSELKFRTSISWEHEMKTPEKELQLKELKAQYEQTLNQMPENQRVVFLMNRFDKKSYKEIAEANGIGQKAVEKRMSLALKFLRKKITLK